jgi:hypothetical protein
VAPHHAFPDQHDSCSQQAEPDEHRDPVGRSIEESDVGVARESRLVQPRAEREQGETNHAREDTSDNRAHLATIRRRREPLRGMAQGVVGSAPGSVCGTKSTALGGQPGWKNPPTSPSSALAGTA